MQTKNARGLRKERSKPAEVMNEYADGGGAETADGSQAFISTLA